MAEVTLSLGILAAEFGMSRDVLRRVLSEAAVSPAAKKGGHPVYRLRDVYRAIQRQSDVEQLTPHARLALAKAVLAEDEIRVRRGELLERFEVEQEQARILRCVALFADTLPDVVERDVGLSAGQITRIERALDQMRESLHKALTDEDTDAESPAAASDDRTPRGNGHPHGAPGRP